jgi:hypothetical protein
MLMRAWRCKPLHDRPWREPAVLGEFVKQFAALEAAHLYNGIDEFIRTVESEATIRLPGDSADGEIDLRCRAPVQGQFGLAKVQPSLRRGEVKERETDGAFQLESTMKGQEHH